MKDADIRRIFAKVQSPSPGKSRRSLTRKERDDVEKKTAGTCHFCGTKLNGRWQADHVIIHLFGCGSEIDSSKGRKAVLAFDGHSGRGETAISPNLSPEKIVSNS